MDLKIEGATTGILSPFASPLRYPRLAQTMLIQKLKNFYKLSTGPVVKNYQLSSHTSSRFQAPVLSPVTNCLSVWHNSGLEELIITETKCTLREVSGALNCAPIPFSLALIKVLLGIISSHTPL